MKALNQYRWTWLTVLVAATAIVACGGTDVATGPDAHDIGLAKAASRSSAGTATLVATVTSGDVPLADVVLAVSRSVSGARCDFAWTGMTDENGRVEVEILAAGSRLCRGGLSGYYVVKATDAAGGVIGEWGSIPINDGAQVVAQLPVGGRAVLCAGISQAIYAFGDSYVDVGNFYEAAGQTYPPDPPYWNGRWQDGPNFVDVIAENLGLDPLKPSATGGTVYGFGGATVADDWDYDGILVKSVKTQVEEYLATLDGASADRRGLFVLEAGAPAGAEGMDEEAARAYVVKAADDMVALVQGLADRGARSFLVVDAGDMANIPIDGYWGIPFVTELCDVYNERLAAGLGDIRGICAVCFQFGTWMDAVKPQFTVTDALFLSQTESTDPNTYLWWDDWGHMTAQANRMLGNALTEAVVRGRDRNR